MTKNLMSEFIKMIGVEYGEVFKLRKQDTEEVEDGLFCFDEKGKPIKIHPDGRTFGASYIVYDILNGYYEIIKLPFEPTPRSVYWTIVFDGDGKPFADWRVWGGDSIDFSGKALGIIYRTKEEAMAHMAEGYEKLTGKKLEEQTMDEEKKKQINDAIAVLRDMCNKHQCGRCPFSHNCGKAEHCCAFPYHWENIE